MDKPRARVMSEGVVWLSGSTVVLKVLTVINIFYILRNLSIYEYGVVELVLSIIPLFEPFFVPGLSSAVVADVSVEKGMGNLSRVKLLIDNFFKLQFLLCLVAWVIVFFGASIIASFYPDNVANFFRIISFIFLFAPFRSMFSIVFSVYFKFAQQSVQALAEELSKLFFMVIFFTYLHDNSSSLLLAIVGSQLFTVFIGLPAFIAIYRKLPQYTERIPFWHLFQDHGKWSIFASYLSTISQNIQLWIIKIMLGTEAVGLFAVAQGFVGHIVSLVPIDKILSTLVPQHMGDRVKFNKLMDIGVKYQLLGNLAVSIGAFVFAPIFIAIVVPKYLPAMGLFKILLISVPILSFVPVLNNVFLSFKKQKNLFFANMIFKAGATLLFTPILIHYFGLSGIGYTGIIVATLFVLERYRVVKKIVPEFRIHLNKIFSFDEYDMMIITQLLKMFHLKKA